MRRRNPKRSMIFPSLKPITLIPEALYTQNGLSHSLKENLRHLTRYLTSLALQRVKVLAAPNNMRSMWNHQLNAFTNATWWSKNWKSQRKRMSNPTSNAKSSATIHSLRPLKRGTIKSRNYRRKNNELLHLILLW